MGQPGAVPVFTVTQPYSSAEEDISKTIGVVLVIDCSQSLGTAFSSVKTAANSFIDTLAAR